MHGRAKAGSAAVATAAAMVCVVGFAAPRALPTPVRIDVNFTWGSGTHECETPRAGSVICITGEATIAGLGVFEYARDGVPTGGTTSDGCSQYSTRGTIYITGGTAIFDGSPAPTCGATDVPDAHYDYTISAGTGILAGATGTGDIVADHGFDRWHGTLDATGLHPKRSTSGFTPLAMGSTAAAVVVVVVGSIIVVRRRRRTPANESSVEP